MSRSPVSPNSNIERRVDRPKSVEEVIRGWEGVRLKSQSLQANVGKSYSKKSGVDAPDYTYTHSYRYRYTYKNAYTYTYTYPYP